jgi:hypothetical protein
MVNIINKYNYKILILVHDINILILKHSLKKYNVRVFTELGSVVIQALMASIVNTVINVRVSQKAGDFLTG